MHKGNFDGRMRVSKNMKAELNWWISNIMSQKRITNRGIPDMTITTDASNDGWGAVKEDVNIGGRWKDNEKIHHINYLEFMAIYLAVKSFCKSLENLHFKICSIYSSNSLY